MPGELPAPCTTLPPTTVSTDSMPRMRLVDREVVVAEHGEVGQLARGDAALAALLAREPGRALGLQAQARVSRSSRLASRVERQAADGPAR